MTKHIHQQCIRAAAGIEFAETAVIFEVSQLVGNRQNFAQTLAPDGAPQNRAIARRMKIAVRLTFEIRKKDHAPGIKMAAPKVNPIRLRILHSSLRDFLAEL
jgi:hypothetical protein